MSWLRLVCLQIYLILSQKHSETVSKHLFTHSWNFFLFSIKSKTLWLCTILMLKQRMYRHVNTPSHPFSSCTDNSLRNIWHLLTKLKLPTSRKTCITEYQPTPEKKMPFFNNKKKPFSSHSGGKKKRLSAVIQLLRFLHWIFFALHSYTRNCLCATCNFFFHFAMLLPTPEKICHQRLLIFFYQKEVARGKKRSKVAKFNGTFSRM